ncbi:MAG TPA: hypothetical protein VK446_10230, partial [Methylocystis sp.]|nr:hypothetical protein [Methylocystis sp.]
TNTGSTPVDGPLYLLFRNLPQGVYPANRGSGVSICLSPDTPLIRVALATLSPGASTTHEARFTDPAMTPISYTTSVLAGARP